MKIKLLSLALLAVATLFGCKQTAEAEAEEEMATEEVAGPDYADFERKVGIISDFYEAHGNEDLAAQTAMLSDTLEWSPPNYNGNKWLGKEDFIAALKGYHDTFDNIKFTPGVVTADDTVNGYWSGSVFPEENASSNAAVIRVYGTWTATHTESGKEIGVKFYSTVSVNDDGQIVAASDYFDVGGLMDQVEAQE